MRAPFQDITGWLNSPELGEHAHAPAVGDELFDFLYDELHRIARRHMYREQAGHTLSATVLTHEAWLRLHEKTRTRWAGRAHFLAVASTTMRRILVNHAVAKHAEKRSASLLPLTAADAVPAASADEEVVAVHEALLAFEAVDARAARVVELKFFGGMENAEVAEALGLSIATVKRDWSLARAWLLRELSGAA